MEKEKKTKKDTQTVIGFRKIQVMGMGWTPWDNLDKSGKYPTKKKAEAVALKS